MLCMQRGLSFNSTAAQRAWMSVELLPREFPDFNHSAQPVTLPIIQYFSV